MDAFIPLGIGGLVMLLIWAILHYCGYYADGTEEVDGDEGLDGLPERQ